MLFCAAPHAHAQTIVEVATISEPLSGDIFTADASGQATVPVASLRGGHRVRLNGPYTGSINYVLEIFAGVSDSSLAPWLAPPRGISSYISYIGSAYRNLPTSGDFFFFGASCNVTAGFQQQSAPYTAKAWATPHLTYSGAPTHNPGRQDVSFTIKPH